ncbi:hypothetical protein GDO78_006768 [Eleutherodactylus coqui]|uniref:Uncharacterized protein n=1 Tax=Eleutherodactylus coqui TaxID=57060 RepID=A0A8J6KAA9_ELECQ|nr:hypothetical protein GDO78_006768 [Eleutherodactylus coqui]
MGILTPNPSIMEEPPAGLEHSSSLRVHKCDLNKCVCHWHWAGIWHHSASLSCLLRPVLCLWLETITRDLTHLSWTLETQKQ